MRSVTSAVAFVVLSGCNQPHLPEPPADTDPAGERDNDRAARRAKDVVGLVEVDRVSAGLGWTGNAYPTGLAYDGTYVWRSFYDFYVYGRGVQATLAVDPGDAALASETRVVSEGPGSEDGGLFQEGVAPVRIDVGLAWDGEGLWLAATENEALAFFSLTERLVTRTVALDRSCRSLAYDSGLYCLSDDAVVLVNPETGETDELFSVLPIPEECKASVSQGIFRALGATWISTVVSDWDCEPEHRTQIDVFPDDGEPFAIPFEDRAVHFTVVEGRLWGAVDESARDIIVYEFAAD